MTSVTGRVRRGCCCVWVERRSDEDDIRLRIVVRCLFSLTSMSAGWCSCVAGCPSPVSPYPRQPPPRAASPHHHQLLIFCKQRAAWAGLGWVGLAGLGWLGWLGGAGLGWAGLGWLGWAGQCEAPRGASDQAGGGDQVTKAARLRASGQQICVQCAPPPSTGTSHQPPDNCLILKCWP